MSNDPEEDLVIAAIALCRVPEARTYGPPNVVGYGLGMGLSLAYALRRRSPEHFEELADLIDKKEPIPGGVLELLFGPVLDRYIAEHPL